MTLHILPINDLRDHEEESTCPCGPKLEVIEGNMMFIHNAWDLREVVERATEGTDITGVDDGTK